MARSFANTEYRSSGGAVSSTVHQHNSPGEGLEHYLRHTELWTCFVPPEIFPGNLGITSRSWARSPSPRKEPWHRFPFRGGEALASHYSQRELRAGAPFQY